MTELNGPEKVATFLLSLDKESSAAVLRHIGREVLTEIADAMTRIDPEVSTHARVVELKRQLAIQATAPAPVKPKKEEELGQFLSDGVGAASSREVVGKIRERRLSERPFLELEQHATGEVARVLADESPAVCAVVLAHIDPAKSAAILGTFDPELALGIVKRMATLVPPGLGMLQAISSNVLERIAEMADGPVAVEPEKRLKTIAAMLNFSNPEIEQSVLEGLSEESEATAQEIREHMFAWGDLATIDKRAMQKILGSVDTRTLSISLKACAPEVEENIMANLSARVRDMVAEERELAGAMPLNEVLAARNQVMTTVRGMIESGEFSPARSGAELVS
jgi:flagellar motor switch protein FliG